VGLRGPGYDSGSGLAPLLRNRDKRYLLYLMACVLSGEVVLPRAYDTDIYLTGLGMLLTTVLLPNPKHRGTQVSCPTLRERRRPIRIGEVLAVILD